MTIFVRSTAIALAGLGISMLAARTFAADENPETVQARWRPTEVSYSYTGFTTAYDCQAFEAKMKRILLTVGSHPNTKVRATGCQASRASSSFFVTITTAIPVPADQEPVSQQDQSKQELLKRLGAPNAAPEEQFAAVRKRIDLNADRRLNLGPGDCELMEDLRDKVLPKLGVEIVEQHLMCTPNQISIRTPELAVSALVPVKSPDVK